MIQFIEICKINALLSHSTEINCKIGAGRIECPRSIRPGMTATIECKIGYKKDENVQKEFVCQENGEWNGQPYECTASCGQVVVNSKPLVLEIQKTNPLEVPWIAA